MRDKIKVLFLAADPFQDRARLRLDEEVRAVDHAIRKGTAADRLILVSSFDTRIRDLQDALLRHQPQIVHFAGHGGESGVIYLGDAYGRPQPVGKEALARLFGILETPLRAVVLNACDTLSTVEVLRDVVDFAIGMNSPVADASAIVFAEAFYGALAMGQTVPKSFEYGVVQLDLESDPEAKTPVLRMRPGAVDEPHGGDAHPREAGPGMINRIGDAKVNGAATFENRGRAGRTENIIDRLESDSLGFLS